MKSNTVAGVYGIAAYAHQDSPVENQSYSGTLTLGADGTFSATFPNGNSDLNPFSLTATLSGTYKVADNGAVSFTSQSGETSTGFIGANGTGAVALTSTDATSEEIYVASKLGSAITATTVAGNYGIVGYAHQDGPVENQVVSGILTIAADGTFSGAITNGNSDLNSLNLSGTLSGTYTLGANGELTATSTLWGDTSTGFIGANGTGALAMTSTNATSEEIWVASRLGSATSVATVAGIYGIVGYAHSDSPIENESNSGTLTLGADGKFSATLTNGNSDLSSVNFTDTGSGTYTVAANGALTLFDDGGETLTGFVGADGTIAIALTSVNAHSEELYIGIPIGFSNGDDSITGGAGDDVIDGGDGNDDLRGGDGNDQLIGGAGDDSLDGGTGDDDLSGGDGNDQLDGGTGADNMAGGSGADTYIVDNSGDVVLETDNTPSGSSGLRLGLDLGSTIDTVQASISYALTNYAENLQLATGAGNLAATGNSLDNVLVGNAGDNTLTGAAGNDTLDGSTGTDTALFSGNLSAYTLTKTGSTYSVRDNSGTDGTDTLTNIESLKFADKTVNLTVQALSAAAPQADVTRLTELYVAFFNRVPDADGLAFWIGRMGAGQGINQIAEDFYSAGVANSATTGYTSDMADIDFVKLIYKNVLGRTDTFNPPEPEALTFWTEGLTSKSQTHGSLVDTILTSAHTFKGDITWGWVADLLDNKITVAKTFAVNWGLNYNTPDDSISHGMAIAAAVTPTGTTDAIALIGVAASEMHLG